MHRKNAKSNDTLLTALSSKGNSAYYECSVSIGALVDAAAAAISDSLKTVTIYNLYVALLLFEA